MGSASDKTVLALDFSLKFAYLLGDIDIAPDERCRNSSILPSRSAIGFSKSRKTRIFLSNHHSGERRTIPACAVGYNVWIAPADQR